MRLLIIFIDLFLFFIDNLYQFVIVRIYYWLLVSKKIDITISYPSVSQKPYYNKTTKYILLFQLLYLKLSGLPQESV